MQNECAVLYCHLWPVRLYSILSSVACPAVQYIVICGLSGCTVYCHLWPVRLYSILSSVACPAVQYIVICGLSGCTVHFPHYLIKGTNFGKKLLNIKWASWFFMLLQSGTFLILRRTGQDIITTAHISVCMYSARFYSCRILIKLVFCIQIFEKSSNMKFHENLSSGGRFVPYVRTDRQTWQS